MNYNEFFKSLKDNGIKQVYLFHGEEEYIKQEAYKGLLGKILPQFEELNLSIFDTGSVDEMITACDSAPFMTDYRAVVCRFMPKDKDAKKLLDYFEKMPSTTVFVFYIKGKADGKLAITKRIKALGGEVIFDFLEPSESAKWIMQNALKKGCTVNAADAQFMVNLVGKDMLSIRNELSKLCDYVGTGGVITKEIISEIVIKNLEFQLYNAYAFFVNGKMQDGMRSLAAILSGKDRESEAMGIAGYFLSCLKATLVAYDLQAKKAPQSEMEAATGKKGYALRDLCANAKRFKRDELLCGITAFCDVSRLKITAGYSSYNALIDAIMTTFGKIGKKPM